MNESIGRLLRLTTRAFAVALLCMPLVTAFGVLGKHGSRSALNEVVAKRVTPRVPAAAIARYGTLPESFVFDDVDSVALWRVDKAAHTQEVLRLLDESRRDQRAIPDLARATGTTSADVEYILSLYDSIVSAKSSTPFPSSAKSRTLAVFERERGDVGRRRSGRAVAE